MVDGVKTNEITTRAVTVDPEHDERARQRLSRNESVAY